MCVHLLSNSTFHNVSKISVASNKCYCVWPHKETVSGEKTYVREKILNNENAWHKTTVYHFIIFIFFGSIMADQTFDSKGLINHYTDRLILKFALCSFRKNVLHSLWRKAILASFRIWLPPPPLILVVLKSFSQAPVDDKKTNPSHFSCSSVSAC